MTRKYDEWLKDLTLRYVEVGGVNTAVRTYRSNCAKTYLFMHGVGGDYHGLVPLAYLLKDEVNVVFVDLPCHGSSELMKAPSLAAIFHWAEQLLPRLNHEGIVVDGVIAHSFGCAVAEHMNAERVWYLNPPHKPTEAAKRYATIMYRWRGGVKWVYEWYPWAVWRGKALLWKKTEHAITLVKWVTRRTKVSPRQIVAHAILSNEFIHDYTVRTPKCQFVGVVSAEHDATTYPAELQPDIHAHLSVETGHMSYFEELLTITDAIRKTL